MIELFILKYPDLVTSSLCHRAQGQKSPQRPEEKHKKHFIAACKELRDSNDFIL